MNAIVRLLFGAASTFALLAACAQSNSQDPEQNGFYPVRVWIMDFHGDDVRVSLGDNTIFDGEYAEGVHDYPIDEIYFSNPGPLKVEVVHSGNIEEMLVSLNDNCNQIFVSPLDDPMIEYTDYCGSLID